MNNIEIHNADCMKFLPDYPDNHFDLAIVDPPYGIKEPAFRKTARTKLARLTKYCTAIWQQDKPGPEYFDQLFRVSKNQIIWGGNYFGLSASRCWIVWDKHTKDTQWADAELAWTSFDKSVKIFDFAWNGMIQGNMKNKEKRIHPTQKPAQLYKWLLMQYAKPGDTILDTHADSLSIAIACYDLGFDLTAFEIVKKYYNDAMKRFETHKQQMKINFET